MKSCDVTSPFFFEESICETTALNQTHHDMKAKMVDFGGWDMPLHYGSQLDEHHKVRSDAGMFDVSHMLALDIKGEAARDFLRRLVANNVDKLTQSGQGALFLHAQPRGWGNRRSHHLFSDGIAFPHGRQCRYRRQGYGVDAGAT